MDTQVIIGSGKLYDGGGRQVVALVTHKIWENHQTEDTLGEWGGEIAIDRVIWPSGEYIIELENGRKGTCIIDIDQWTSGCPTIYRYSLIGCSELI